MEFNLVIKKCFDFINNLTKRKNENLKEEVFELFTYLIKECGEVVRLLVCEKINQKIFQRKVSGRISRCVYIPSNHCTVV